MWSDIWNVPYIELRILKSSKPWSSQFWTQFKQLRTEAGIARSRVQTPLKSWLFQASVRNCLNCVQNCDDHGLLEVISSRRKNENVFKMSKDEKCTSKACKNTVFHCHICKFVGFLLPSSSWLLKLPFISIGTSYLLFLVQITAWFAFSASNLMRFSWLRTNQRPCRYLGITWQYLELGWPSPDFWSNWSYAQSVWKKPAKTTTAGILRCHPFQTSIVRQPN